MVKLIAATTTSRRRNSGPRAPITGIGRSAAVAATTKRSGSDTWRAASGSRTKGTAASANRPRKPSDEEASELITAVRPEPTP